MISLNINNQTNISLNNYIINSINLFKYTPRELYKYVIDKCHENPLIYIKDHQQIPDDLQADGIMESIRTHFNCILSKNDKYIMEFIISSLSSKGFLETLPADIAGMTNTSVDKVERLILMLKNYDARGIGSYNAIDYIEYQLKQDNTYNDDFFDAFKHHMIDINQNNFKFLIELNIELDDFTDYLNQYIKTCNIYPLDGEASIDIVPEGFIRPVNGKLQIQIEDYLANDIVFEPIVLTKGETDFANKIKAYRDEYAELVSMLKARKLYMLKILNVICDVQRDYLSGKTDYLNTLDQTSLAELTELSPATISRLISQKYISTPRGILPIQSLLSKECYRGYSVSHVKFIIQNITDYDRLSDNKISLLLGELGIKISRRTVNKYKNQILQSS